MSAVRRKVSSEGAYLGTIGNNFSTRSNAGIEASVTYAALVARRFALQSEARRLLPLSHAVRGCLRLAIPGVNWVQVCHTPASAPGDFARGSLRRVRVCRSVWACPVCSSTITERRRLHIARLIEAAKGSGLRVLMVSLTFSHRRYDDLSVMLDGAMAAFNRLWAGRSGIEFRRRYGVVGFVRALETTHGELNGWHPHFHLLIFLPVEADLAAFDAALRFRWLCGLRKCGLSADEAHGIHVSDCEASAAAYVAKWGHERAWDESHELTKWTVKRGRGSSRTPFDLLALSADGDAAAGALFALYADAFHGRRQVQYSGGLSALLLGEDEASDEALIDEADAVAQVLALVRSGAFRAIPGNAALPDLLVAAASGEFDQVAAICAACGIGAGDLLRYSSDMNGSEG